MEYNSDSSESSAKPCSSGSLNENDGPDLTPIKTKIQLYWDCPQPQRKSSSSSNDSGNINDNGRSDSGRSDLLSSLLWLPLAPITIPLSLFSRTVEDLQVVSRPDDDEEFEPLI